MPSINQFVQFLYGFRREVGAKLCTWLRVFSGEIDEMEQTGAAKCSASLFGVQRTAQRSFTNADRPEPGSRMPNGTLDPLMRL